jgi:hypothetical protein
MTYIKLRCKVCLTIGLKVSIANNATINFKIISFLPSFD